MDERSTIPDVQEAIRGVEGVASATVRWPDPAGPVMLRVEFASGHDVGGVTQSVLDTLRDISGVDPETLEVQTPKTARPGTARGSRPVFAGLSVDRGELDTVVEVSLEIDGRRVIGRAEGLATRQATLVTTAAAALTALRELLPNDVRVQLDWLEVTEPGSPGRLPLVQSAVTCLTREGEELYVGSALARGDIREAAVRATLDAINRRLTHLLALAS